MITIANFKNVLTDDLGFVEDKKKNIFSKQCNSDLDSIMSVDFNEKKLIYPSKLKVHRETTTNFKQDENFVVFECITRLLIKGYKPEHIELEKPMPGGHHDTGGYCDILIKDNSEKTFLLIECKKADEFDYYWKKMLVNGGQLFNYYNSYRQAQALCLYTSEYTTEGGLNPISHIVSMIDNDQYLQSDKKLKSFRQVQEDNGGKDEYFEVWKDTYQLDYNTRGIFEDDIAAYTVGKLKYTLNDLIEVDSESIQKKYYEFATILRQHNVGSHENAFDKLVNLFLAKIVDEFVNGDELQFYWKGAAHDDYFSLQDRLQKLYKEGMEKFLGEQVTYIDQKEISESFHLFKNDPDATRNKVLEYFRQLKFFTNNDFTFLDVHNETLFYQNAIILKKVVQMLEDIKLKTEEQNQFLGDLFEGFLDQGIKQSEGQYFTPMPIVKFLISSLPLEKLIQNSAEIPYAIDFACGAGHFLNEYASCIKPLVIKHKSVPVQEYYKCIVGIEKEYRLSKVSKVSAFMYGQDDIQIIYGDALAKNTKIENDKYSVIVANPPYSVKGFLETLTEEERDNYTLSANVSDISKNNSIETFFVERAKQLLKGDGVAAIVLPSSILSNGNIYISCREIILKYFDIVAIAEFGSVTFGKTGTNTATLFLRRKKSNPDLAEHYQNRVHSWFGADTSKDIVFEDDNLIEEYCLHCNIDVDEYKLWLNGGITPTADIFKEYEKKAKESTGYKNIQKKKITKRYLQVNKNDELASYIERLMKSAEKEKLYYFMLAASNSCSVVVSKSPADNKAMKKFLGYEWSGAKGNEGIKYIGTTVAEEDDAIIKNKGINSIVTPLFNPQDYSCKDKINTLIRDNFEKGSVTIPDTLNEFVSVYRLVDMIDFSRVEFDKSIKTSVITTISNINFKYSTKPLEQLLKKVNGNTTKIGTEDFLYEGKYPVVTQENGKIISGYSNTDFPITDTPLIIFGDHSCTFKYVDFEFVRGADGTQLIKVDDSVVLSKYLFYFLLQVEIENAEKYERHFKYLKTKSIPIPPLEVQQQIVKDCEAVEEEYNKANEENERLYREIEFVISSISGTENTLKTIAPYTTRRITYDSINPSSYVSTDNMLQNCEGCKEYEGVPNIDKVIEYKVGDILVSNIRPYLKKIWFADKDGGCSPDVLVFHVTDTSTVIPKFVYYSMKRDVFFNWAMSDVKGMKMPRGKKDTISAFKIAVPPMAEQQRIVNRIDEIESKIDTNTVMMNSCSKRKKDIIEKALM